MSTKTNSTRQPLILGLLIGILLGAVVVLHGLEVLPGGYKYAAFAISVSIFLVAILFLLAIYYRDWIIKKLFGDMDNVDSVLEETHQYTATIASAVTGLALKGTNLTPEAKERAKAFAPRAASFILWRNVRNWWFRVLVAIIVAIGGLATTILLVNQNKLLEIQNEKIEVQNQKIETQNQRVEIQTSLMEAERRGALVFLMSNILSDIKEEIKEQKQIATRISNDSLANLNEGGFGLSQPLVGRIAALSQGFLPYRVWQSDTLTHEEYSIERGQLLLSLANSQLDSSTLRKIYETVVFQKSYLVDAVLVDRLLTKIDLRHADLRHADLRHASLQRANLLKAKMQAARLGNANLTSAQLYRANLRGADLSYANLSKANLQDANLFATGLHQTNFDSTDLSGANLSHIYMYQTDFTDAKLYGVDLSRSVIDEPIGINKANLRTCSSLYETVGIEEWKTELEKERPCLFTAEGCRKKESPTNPK